MAPFRTHSVADIIVVELIVPGLSEGPLLDELAERLPELIGRSRSKRIILDFSKVQFIASRALAVLVSLRHTIECHKGDIAVCGVRRQVQQTFRFSGLDRVFTFHRCVDDAVASLSAPAA